MVLGKSWSRMGIINSGIWDEQQAKYILKFRENGAGSKKKTF